MTELLEIAHIQDDLLERLLADARIPEARKAEIESALNGRIQGLTEVCPIELDRFSRQN